MGTGSALWGRGVVSPNNLHVSKCKHDKKKNIYIYIYIYNKYIMSSASLKLSNYLLLHLQ
jgi:hypothetical protein